MTRATIPYFAPLLLLVAAGSVAFEMKASMADFPLEAPAAQPLTDAVLVDATDVRFSHIGAGNPANGSNLGHDMADINERYARMVTDALFPGAAGPPAGKATLVLESVEMVQVTGKGFVSFDITEQLTANWALYTSENTKPILRVAATGSDAAKSGTLKTIAQNARERMGGAYQALLHNTVTAFQNSIEFSRFAAMPALYTDSENRVAVARSILESVPVAERADTLDTMLRIGVTIGDAELYAFARSEGAIGDETELLHAAIAAPGFSDELVIEMLGRVDDLEVLDDEGLSPLEAALVYGREPVSVALVEVGADPVVNYAGNSFVSAEIAYRLTGLLAASRAPTGGVAREAIIQYRHAIDDAEFAIQHNDASIFAAKVMRVLGPVVQYSVAVAEANVEAGQSADSSPAGLGFGYADFRLNEYDVKSPAAAIEDLRAIIADCEARIRDLEKFL
jgi:hypothetical protein